jgi:thioredoxin-related protein
MKKTIFSLLFSMGSLLSYGQIWHTNFDTAKAEALAANKPIIMAFQGSDWCAPCIKLDKEIWHSKAFIDYAESHYVLLKVDFPRRRENKLSKEQQAHNGSLAERYNQQGTFPLVLVFDANAKLLGQTSYKKVTPDEYLTTLNTFLNQ